MNDRGQFAPRMRVTEAFAINITTKFLREW